MASDTRSGRKIKDDDSNNSKRRHIGGKEPIPLDSAMTDTYGLRRSAREPPSKKQMVLSPSNPQKSERLEKRTSTTPPVKRKSERVEKQRMPSPSRRSEKGEKRLFLSSSGSKKSKNGLSILDTKKKKEKKEKSGKQSMLDVKESGSNEKQDQEPVHVILKNKRLDARSYRALLRARSGKAKESDHNEMLKSRGKSQGDSDNDGSSGFKEVEEGGDDCSERKGEEQIDKNLGIASKRAAEGSCSDLRKSGEGTSRNLGEVESSQFSRKRKDHLEEALESENGDSLPVSKCSDSSLQPSPHGVMAKEVVDDAEMVQADCSARDDLHTLELIEPSFEGISLVGDVDLGMDDKVRAFKRMRKTVDMGFDVSFTVVSKNICSSSAEAVLSSPSGSKSNKIFESCVSPSKRQSVDFDSQNRDPCPYGTKVVCDQVAMLRSPQKIETVVTCIQKNGNHGAKEDSDLDVSELLLKAQKQILHGPMDLHTTIEIPIPLENDRGEPEARSSTGLAEKCDNEMQRKESLLEINTQIDPNACFVCKLGGKLLCCDGKGCKRSYHLSCIDPPLKIVSPGVWHCLWCVKKKIESGVHSVSEGVESIWDAKEVEVSDHEGMRRQKQYLVKYTGLAHIHDRWVSEIQLLLEAPTLVAKFNRKNQVVRGRLEWTVPHRLLQKKLLMSPKQRDEYQSWQGADISDCHYEWLVKWSGLGYEHATWELENASFFRSPEAMTLIRDYESRHEKAKKASDHSRVDKVLLERKGLFFKPSDFPGGGPPGLDNYHVTIVNKLREYWHTGQNAVVIDEQERVMKVILFILSLQSDVCRPFLIISTYSALSVWEAEFLRLAPSVNVVVYNGTRDVRKSIRTLEFYDEGGCIMFQVLLSPPDPIVEDLEVLECLGWEAIIIDECQRSRVSTQFEQIKALTTEFRLLLVNGQIKDSIAEYLNLLSFLDSKGEGIDNDDDSNDNIGKLKERFAQFIAFERKSDSSRFLEYWVPVPLSNVQLEHYCATLLSNSTSLRSCSKNDPVGALRDILISTRKCCDHPYLVESTLQNLLTKDLPAVEYLDIGVKASGKLHFLDKILTEIKSRGLRVLILFQSIVGSGRNSIGDILDDFMRQRFGPDSYERIDSGGYVPSKKQAALNMFNNKESGRFVFLIENRACLPSIKLSSVDTVILFDSDWNPFNDLRALQRISIDSHFEQLKVFRLYSSFTVEEKVLILAKKGMTLDSNTQNISRSTSHMLLIWGASYLFGKLDELHGCNTPASGSSISSEQSLFDNVLQDLLTQLPHNGENNVASNCSIILKVQQSGATYPKNISLLGELEMQLRDEEIPHIFWTKVLEGRRPLWRYSSGPSQRIRRKVQYFDELSKKSKVESDEAVKKRKKLVNDTIDPISPKYWIEDRGKVVAEDKKGASGTPAGNGSQLLPRSTASINEIDHVDRALSVSPVADGILKGPEVHIVESEERMNLRDTQKSLHLLLKPEISKLCEILHLPEDVKAMLGRFLEYIMNNHHVTREPVTILQAFQISLCWTAASLLKHKIDRKESLALAKQHLNFDCKEEEADFIYSKLRMLKKMFSQRTENAKETNSPEDPAPRSRDVAEILLHAGASQLTTSDQKELDEGKIQKNSLCSYLRVSAKQEQPSDSKMVQKNDVSNSIRRLEKKCAKRMKKLLQKQQQEVHELNKIREKEKAKLEKEYSLESVIIRNIHRHISLKKDKLKMLDHDFAKKMEEHNRQMERRRKRLEAMQLVERNEEKQMMAHWLEEAKSGRPVELLGKLPLPDFGFRVKHMDTSEKIRVCNGHKSAAPMSGLSLEIQNPDGLVPSIPSGIIPSEVAEIVPSEAIECGIPTETVALPSVPSRIAPSEVPDNVRSEAIDCGITMKTETVPSVPSGVVTSEVPETVLSEAKESDLPPEMETLTMNFNRENDGMCSLTPGRETFTGVKQHNSTGSSSDGLTDAVPISGPSSEKPNPDGVLLSLPGGELPVEVPETVQNEAVEGGGSIETESLAMQSNRENDRMDTMASERSTVAGVSQDNRAGNSISGDSSSLPQNQIDSPPAEPLSTRAQNGPLLSPQVLPVERSQLPISAVVREGDGSSNEVWNSPQQVEVPLLQPLDAVTSDQSIHDTLVVESVSQFQLPQSTVLPLQPLDAVTSDQSIHDTLVVESVSQFQLPQSTVLPLQPLDAVTSDQSIHDTLVLESVSQFQLPQSTVLPSAEHNQPTVPVPTEIQHLPANDGHSLVRQVEVPTLPPVEAPAELSDNSIQQLVTHLPLHPPVDTPTGGCETHISDLRSTSTIPEFINRPVQTVPVTSRMPQPGYSDPLRNEMERIRKEREQAIKIHEDTKLRLKSECDKEIEETLAQIRRKYDDLLQDAEITLVQKRKALETNYNKVFMNKMLAEAFRSKCRDPWVAEAPGLQQAVPSSFMHQLLHLPVSLQQPPQRPTSAAVQQMTLPPVAPPVQVVHHSSALFSSNPVRLPYSTIDPPTGNLQVSSELRAPAPHLQPFRSATPNLPPLSHGIPSQQAPSNPPVLSSMLPQHTPRPPTYASGPYSRTHQPESARGLPAPNNTSISVLEALEQLMDLDNCPGLNPPNLFPPPLQDTSPNCDTRDLPELAMTGIARGVPTSAGAATDFVCLSDDD